MSDPSNDVSPTIQEPQRVPENTDSDTQVVDEELEVIHNLMHQPHYALIYPETEMELGYPIAKRILEWHKQLLGQQLVKELEQTRTNAIYNKSVMGVVGSISRRIGELEAQYNLNPKERSE